MQGTWSRDEVGCGLRAGMRTWAGLARSIASLALLGSLVAGCATGNYIYSPARDKQGQASVQSWSKVDLAAQIDVPRRNLKKTLDEQLALEADIWRLHQEARAQNLALDWTVGMFKTQVGDELRRVVGGSTNNDAAKLAKTLQADLKAAKVQAEEVRAAAVAIQRVGIAPPSCELLLKRDPADLETMQQSVAAKLKVEAVVADYWAADRALEAACQKLKPVAPEGELGRALKNLQGEEALVTLARELAQSQMKAVKAAQTALDAQMRAVAAGNTDAKARVVEQVEKLKTLLAAMTATGADGNAFAARLLSQERMDSLNKFLATYDSASTGKGAPEGSNRAAVALALFPDLYDKWNATMAAVEQPSLVPYVLRKNVESARLDAAERDIERRQAIVELRRAQVRLLQTEAEAYRLALTSLETLGAFIKEGDSLKSALEELDESKGQTADKALALEKKNLWWAATRYLEAEGPLRADVGKTRYLIYALENEGVLLIAESSVQQWKALIDPSVALLGEWGAAGVRSADLTALFNSIMLLAIAVGVN